MSEMIRDDIRTELGLLNHLLTTHRALLRKRYPPEPDAAELSALAAVLHSFYTGLENLLKRIVVHVDGQGPEGPAWHSDLLEAVAHPTDRRPAVISLAMRDRLRGYLGFRHVFRHGYLFQLRWDLMAPLVAECDDTLRCVEAELERFVAGLQSGG